MRIRYPNDFTVTTSGVTAVPQNTNEQYTNLTLSRQDHVDLSYSSQDLSLSLDDFSKRVLSPAINNLAGTIASYVMGGAESICNYVSKTSAGAVVSPTANEWLTATAYLKMASAPKGLKAVLDPLTQARTVSTLSGLFNPTGTVAKQYVDGEVLGPALGIGEWMTDQTVIKHTTAAYGILPTVNGASQSGSAITVTATTAPLNQGDIITFAGVYSVNRVTKSSNGTLAQFVVTAPVAIGATSIPIYPALIPPSGGNPVQYQTVTASPANGAAITCVNQASEVYRKNFVYSPAGVVLATGALEMPRGVHDAARESYDGVSLRMVSQYDITSDQFITRLDCLYGWTWVRPEWACIVADAL